MSTCNEILKDGVFDSIVIHTNKSFSENYTEWLKTSSYQEIKQKQSAGLALGIPIEGVPIRWEADFSQEDYNILKQQVDAGEIRNLTTDEESEIVQKSASKVIVDAWVECMKMQSFGLLAYEDVGEDGTFSVLFRYSPNAVGDQPPTVKSLDFTNCKCINPPQSGSPDIVEIKAIAGMMHYFELMKGFGRDNVGSEVPYGGMTLLFVRDRNQQGYFPEATYILNTTKGTVGGKIPALGKLETPKIRDIIFIHATNPHKASWPSCEVEVPEGHKLIGGGARLNWKTAGSFLTASYPAGPNKWLVKGKDHGVVEPVTCDAWAIAIYDPNNEFEVDINWADSDQRSWPQRYVSATNGFQLVGGGALAHWNVWGQLLTASHPIGRDTWSARSKDHINAEPNTITTYAIGLRPRNEAKNVEIQIREVTVGPAEFPEGRCPAPDNCRLIGGGVIAN